MTIAIASQPSPRWPLTLRPLLLLALAGSALYFVVLSFHWAMLCDSAIMHYVNFLMGHGLQPYSQIGDNNLPGAYLTESWAMHLFGGSDLAWRVYEFFLLAVLTLAMVLIARPYDWLAGVYAGGLFLLLHGAEGPWYAVEREQVMTVLLMIGYACLFFSVRWKRPLWMLWMGFTAGMAASIKPTVTPLALILVLVAAVVLHRRQVRAIPYVLWALAGMAVAIALNLGFLLYHHAFSAFLATQRFITPFYAGVSPMPYGEMARMAVPVNTIALIVPAAVLALTGRRWTWEQWTLALGAAVGLTSFFVQHKGFLHHRYMFLTFLLLLVAIELLKGLQRQGWQRWIAAAGIAITLVAIIPHYLIGIATVRGTSDLTPALESDLRSLAPAAKLQGEVQCLDLIYGCLNALYHLQLVENSGFTGDLVIFDPHGGSVVQAQRSLWAERAREHPPTVIVMTNEYFQGLGFNTFDKVDNWPEYATNLAENYTLVLQRSFPDERGAQWKLRQAELGGPYAYRIYIRNGDPLLSGFRKRLGQPLPG